MFEKSPKLSIPNVGFLETAVKGITAINVMQLTRLYFQSPLCFTLIAPKGPFAVFCTKLDPQLCFDVCVFDMCASNGDGKLLCNG